MDWGFTRKLGIKAIALPSSLSVQDTGYISHVTPWVLLVTQEEHMERISFFLLPGPSHSHTLGLPWLRVHNPQMLWAKNQILQSAPSCHRRCFPNKAAPLQATSIESPDADRRVPIPSEYQDLEQVFSPSKAMRLPLHQDWNCAITLKKGAVPPRCRIYSQEEERAMEQYIKEALQQGYVRPSTSLALAGVFFMKKRDWGLRPCVDYQGLNKLLVQYPLSPPPGTSCTRTTERGPVFHKTGFTKRIQPNLDQGGRRMENSLQHLHGPL
ncbi:hypothetical protein P4O66_003369 [Electrophorus voltai]|uniref:Reverse transcriptase/retrotransposon-derived protein RNase H-like domain-containing protein n=1 Tax=Electrophorus voltai TaxID=2609070 RepID=A0AAD8YRS9_9TELE|nr:hypothetical protein P4O66_003369 [Electrophorus voltai]